MFQWQRPDGVIWLKTTTTGNTSLPKSTKNSVVLKKKKEEEEEEQEEGGGGKGNQNQRKENNQPEDLKSSSRLPATVRVRVGFLLMNGFRLELSTKVCECCERVTVQRR